MFTTALGAVESNYVDKVDSARLVYGAIGGMLQTLDPHSSFMDPKYYAQMRERQEGHYYGLGITIQVDRPRHQRRVAVRGHAGLQEGDPPRRHHHAHRAARTSSPGRTSRASRSAGPRCRTARSRCCAGRRARSSQVSLKRPGYDKLIDIQVPRDEITIPSITASFMVDAQTGYVRVQDFAENTDHDLGVALATSRRRG